MPNYNEKIKPLRSFRSLNVGQPKYRNQFPDPQFEAKEQGRLKGPQYRGFAIRTRPISEKMLTSRSLGKKIGSQSQKNVTGGTFPANFQKFIVILYGILKMSHGQLLPDPDLELINVKSLDFAKPKLFFKNIGRYAATSTYIHVRIPHKFWTPKTPLNNTTLPFRTNTKSHSRPLRRPQQMSAWLQSQPPLKTFKTSLKLFHKQPKLKHQADLNILWPSA
jgi:hypothetical protein